MRPLAEMSDEIAARIRIVLTDIDDTMTDEGRLTAAAYMALEDLHAAGFVVAPITGRPAGWCDMIARLWPVTGVVGENGAFYFAYDASARRMRRVFAASATERESNRRKLAEIERRILLAVPGAATSADQAYRESDLAIDFCEDVAPLSKSEISRIKAEFEAAGATAKVSSIHVNGWFGDYDKLAMTRRFAAEIAGFDIDAARDGAIFVGDSPNDAPMFGFFPHAVGVANILAFADELEATPAYVTRGRGGQGFIEVAERLLAARGRA